MFCDWAFLKHRGDAIDEIWKKIPSNVDILITHGPPLGKVTLFYLFTLSFYEILLAFLLICCTNSFTISSNL